MQKLSMFEEVRKNNLYSNIMVFFFLIFIGILGAAIGYMYGSVSFGFVLAIVFSVIYLLIIRSSGDQMVLGLSGARPADKKEFPYLVNTVEGLAVAAGIPAPKTYVIDDSALNAFATGFSPENASVTVTTGLLKKMKRDELEGVLGHEISHIKNYDTKYMLYIVLLIGVITLLGDFLLRSFWWGGKSRKREDSGNIALIFIIIGLATAVLSPIITELIRLAISRRKEFAADANAAVLTRYPMGLANALRKIKNDPDPLVDTANRATAHLYISTPFRREESLFSTHPPIDERIKRLEAM